MKLKIVTLSTVLAASIGIAHAQSDGMKGMDMKKDKKAAAGTVHKASGKVTRVDPASGSVTIAHGPVASMNWPSMTMSFKAKDKAMLQKVKPGDQVQFSFVQSGKDHTITEIK
jgi:Cu(I)/Ag(I) efflux system periplasmic protein CusF